jgi:hypothetical protein
MKCDKCSHDNSEYNIICEKCGAPLKIENNLFLQEKYRKKGKPIEIIDLEKTQKMPDFNQTKKTVSKAVLGFLIIISLTLIYYLYGFFVDTHSKKLISEYNNLMKNSSLAVLYFGDDVKLNDVGKIYSDNYDFEYLNIRTNDISSRKKTEIRKELNIFNLTSTFVIISNGVPIATVTNIKQKEELLVFLQEHYIVPLMLDDTASVIEQFKTLLDTEEETIIYLPTSYSSSIESNDQALVSISAQYGFNYGKVNSYLLSRKQLLKIMSQLGFSEIQDDLLIYVVDGKVDEIIVDTATDESSYFHLLSSYDIIDLSNEDYLVNLSISKFETLITEKRKSIILIGSENCTYCERVKPILGQIAYQYGITIHYLDSTRNSNIISSLIKESGYTNGLSSTPFVFIVENSKFIECIVGLSDKKLYIEKLTEVGVIK